MRGRRTPRERPAAAHPRGVHEQRVERLADRVLEAQVHQPFGRGGARGGLSLTDLVAVDHRQQLLDGSVEEGLLLGSCNPAETGVAVRKPAQAGDDAGGHEAGEGDPDPQARMEQLLGEALGAGRIEDAFAKRDILTMYINQVYFGDGKYGIEEAAREDGGRRAGADRPGTSSLAER